MRIIACERFGACLSSAITSGRYRAALAAAERFCTYAAKTTDPADGPFGDRLVGLALLGLGDLEGARRHIEHMLGRYVARRSHIIIGFITTSGCWRIRITPSYSGCRDLPTRPCVASNARSSIPAPAITRVSLATALLHQPAPSHFTSAI